MKSSSVKLLVLSIAVVPLLIMLFLLAIIMVTQRVQDTEENLNQLAGAIGQLLVSASADPLITGDDYVIRKIVTGVVSKSEVYSVEIRELEGKTFLFAENAQLANQPDISTRRLSLPIYSYVSTKDNELSISGSLQNENNSQGERIGDLVIHMNRSVSDDKVLEIYQTSGLIGLIVLAITVFVGNLLGRTVTRPIDAISHSVKQIAEGNYEVETDVRGMSKDFIPLAKNIDDLAKNLGAATKRQTELLNANIAAQSQAVKANKAKTEFLANMSHELRSPLHTIRGMLQLTLDQLPERAIQYQQLQLAFAQSQILLDDVDELLDISQIESGAAKVNNEYFILNEFISDINKLYRKQVHDKGLKFTVETRCSPKLERQSIDVYTDKNRLQKIITNLLVNSIKYTAHGGIKMITYIKELEGDGEDRQLRLELSISDTGIGISEKDIEHIFKMFHQLDSSKTKKYEGKGLGLSIAKQYIELLGGEIEVLSEIEKGSTFRVALDLPYRIMEGRRDLKVPIDVKLIENMRILIVEDNLGHQFLLSEYLKRYNLRVDIAANAIEGLNLFQKHTYQLIIIDCFMPGMSGFELAEKIRQCDTSHTPIIGMSADAKGETHNLALAAGMDDFITKPPEDMAVIIEKIYLHTNVKSQIDLALMLAQKGAVNDLVKGFPVDKKNE